MVTIAEKTHVLNEGVEGGVKVESLKSKPCLNYNPKLLKNR